MHKLSYAAIGLGLFMSACAGLPIRPDPTEAEIAASSAALGVVLDKVCIPVALDGGDFLSLVKANGMTETTPSRDTTGQTSQSWRLESGAAGEVTATLWQDGSCMVGIERGDRMKLQALVQVALAGRGHVMKPGLFSMANNGGARQAHCNGDPRPLILAMTWPATQTSQRPALVANLYRAKGGASDICLRAAGSA